jgi:hypothetical protein
MTTLQLVRHRKESGESELNTVENVDKRPPTSFRRNGDKPFLLGSEQLLLIAYGLRDSYRLNRVAFTDSVGQRLSEATTEWITDELRKAALNSDRDAFHSILDGSLDGLYAISIELQDRNLLRGGVVTVYRQGVIEVNSIDQQMIIGRRLSDALKQR